jgi:N-sulfoglucosamine sulfohydrolase
MTRRRFTRDAALALAAAGCGTAEEAVAPRPQNLLVITADDLGWRDLSGLGLLPIETPSLDRLLDEGVVFDRAFDVVSTCSSSRATMVTGQYPHTHGVTGLVHRNPELSLPTDHPTSVRLFQDAGFATAIQGKWHLSDLERPEAFGYDEYLATDIDQVIKDSFTATGFLQTNAGRRWYLELNFMQPHRDVFGNFPQAPGYEVDEDLASPPPYWGLPDWPEIRTEVAGYLSRLRWMDSIIGEVLTELDRQRISESTLVVFISDNGPPFPGNKLSLYDRGVGTPFLFRWPTGLAPARHDDLVSSIDMAPTLLDLFDLPPLPDAQGRSLRPRLEGGDWTPAEAIFSEMERHGGPIPTRAVRTGTHKYIRNLTDDPLGMGGASGSYTDALSQLPEHPWLEPRVPEELYDLIADPLERNNLVDDPEAASVLETLRARLDAHLIATNDPRAP